VLELGPAIGLSAIELGLSLPIEFKVQPRVPDQIARKGLPDAELTALYTTAA
jgi:hypothetical protein